MEKEILKVKKEKPSWGTPKIREKILRQYPDVKAPAISTIHTILDKYGLVTRQKRRRYKAEGTKPTNGKSPNELWCADYKGEFQLGSKEYYYPLTITDFNSRYLLACEGLTTTKEQYAITVFERVFKEYGLPNAIRTDNGGSFLRYKHYLA